MGRVLITGLALLLACQGRDDLDGRRRAIPGLADRGADYALSADSAEVALDLFDNRAAAVVHGSGGLTIECGTADFAKYVDGAYRSRWHLSADDAGERAALVRGLAGELYVPIDQDDSGQDDSGVRREPDGSLRIAIRARAARPRQLASVFLNEKRLGDIRMADTEWRTYAIRAPASTVAAGENKLRFFFRHTGEIDGQSTAAAIQRIRVGASGAMDAPVMSAAPVTRGNQRLGALRVSGPARLSYYVQVPAGRPALLFATAGARTEAFVRVTPASGGASRIWDGATTEAWSAARVDLSAWAGEVVRLDLVSAGPMDWGRPQIVSAAAERAEAEARRARPVADHVVIWVVSALRADRVGGGVPTPAFDGLGARGVRFAGAHTAAPMPGAAHVAMLTGQHPEGNHVPHGALTLGERFSDAGYTTALISGNGFVNDDAGFAQGFSTYQNPMRRRHPFRARVLWQQARRVLQRHRDGRTLLYVVTVEPHLPYTPSAESLAAEWERGSVRFTPAETIAVREAVATGKQSLSKDEQAYITALYNAEVRDADRAFGEMLADLEELGVADRTAVILVADHGEELWERGGFGHGTHLHQEVLRVPLIMALPWSRAGQVVTRDVSLVDVYATALDLAGLAPGAESQGESLLAPPDGAVPRPVLAHLPGHGRSLKLGRYKLIIPLRGGPMLFDLESDPGERDNLAGRQPIIERYMRNIFGVSVAYQTAWSRSRWGAPNNVSPAFAADHGL